MEEELLLALIEAINKVAEPTIVDVCTLLFAMFVFIMTFNDNFDLARTQNRIALYQERLNLFRRVEKHLSILEQIEMETRQPVWNKTTMPEFDPLELKYLFSKPVMKKFIVVENLYKTLIEVNTHKNQSICIEKIRKNLEINKDFLMKKIDYYLDIFSLANKIIIISLFYKIFRYIGDMLIHFIKKECIKYTKGNHFK